MYNQISLDKVLNILDKKSSTKKNTELFLESILTNIMDIAIRGNESELGFESVLKRFGSLLQKYQTVKWSNNIDETYINSLKHEHLRGKINHQSVSEIWVVFFKKKTNKVSLTWPESVDCALSFGWVDGLRKTVDEDRYKICFTPRKPNSVWSKVNVQKVYKLIALNQMRPEGLVVFNQRKDQTGYSLVHRNIPLMKEYEDEIRKNPTSWEFFNQLSPSYKRDSIWWVMDAKKEETRRRRLNRLIVSWEERKRLRP